MTRPWRSIMKLCSSILFRATPSRNERIAADETPSASGVPRGSLPPTNHRVARVAGTNETNPSDAAPKPSCLRKVLRVEVMAEDFRHRGAKYKPEKSTG